MKAEFAEGKTKAARMNKAEDSHGDHEMTVHRTIGAVAVAVWVACVLACGGAGGTGDQVNTQAKKASDPEKERVRRLEAALKVGDKVEMVQTAVCGSDVNGLVEFQKRSLQADWESSPDDLKKTAEPGPKRIAELFRDGKIVRVNSGQIGEVVNTGSAQKVDRSAIKMPPIELVWIGVKFGESEVVCEKSSVEKK